MEQRISQDLNSLVEKLPLHIQEPLRQRADLNQLLEIVLDLGRQPEARFREEALVLHQREVAEEDIRYVTERISPFGEDNRAGIERTLHRISAIRNRNEKVVGLTLRVGRAIYGTIKIIEDLILSGKSVLLLGRPGVGKTTMLREVARVLADDAKKRVVVVDTSNEIAGDGDIPHPGIGRARRMQVPTPSRQHSVMIEAVENHMPEVIVIDEIGNEFDASAARTIAERGVQLVATAHGNTLDNLIINPTLSDLVGGVQTVTLGDEEAKRRRTQKTVLERRAPPTFDILVEIQSWNAVAVHPDVAEVVDRILRGFPVTPETRTVDEEGHVGRTHSGPRASTAAKSQKEPDRFIEPDDDLPATSAAHPRAARTKPTRILPFGVNRGRLRQLIRGAHPPIELAVDIENADLVLTTKSHSRRKNNVLRDAETMGKPVYVLRKNTLPQIHHFIRSITGEQLPTTDEDAYSEADALAVEEVERAITNIAESGELQVHLHPQPPHLRRLQHMMAERAGLSSSSAGREPGRHVVIYR